MYSNTQLNIKITHTSSVLVPKNNMHEKGKPDINMNIIIKKDPYNNAI